MDVMVVGDPSGFVVGMSVVTLCGGGRVGLRVGVVGGGLVLEVVSWLLEDLLVDSGGVWVMVSGGVGVVEFWGGVVGLVVSGGGVSMVVSGLVVVGVWGGVGMVLWSDIVGVGVSAGVFISGGVLLGLSGAGGEAVMGSLLFCRLTTSYRRAMESSRYLSRDLSLTERALKPANGGSERACLPLPRSTADTEEIRTRARRRIEIHGRIILIRLLWNDEQRKGDSSQYGFGLIEIIRRESRGGANVRCSMGIEEEIGSKTNECIQETT